MQSETRTVKYHEANQRLDVFCIKKYALAGIDTSRSECSQRIADEFVLVNNKPAKPSSVLKTGDVVEFLPLPQEATALRPEPDLPVQIIFENKDFVVVDKPSGIATHPSDFSERKTLVNWFIAHYPQSATIGENPLRPGVVHRLDKDTSGLCILAKTQSAFETLKQAFQNREISKTYTALVHGNPHWSQTSIEKPLARSINLGKQTAVGSDLHAKGKIRHAETAFNVLQRFPFFCLVEAKPRTGRKHQIRVHLAALGHPIVGDTLYGFKPTKKIDRTFGKTLKRHLLHASSLEFDFLNEHFSFHSPLPENFLVHIETAKSVSKKPKH